MSERPDIEDLDALVASVTECERELARARAENTAMRPIVAAMSRYEFEEYDGAWHCAFCDTGAGRGPGVSDTQPPSWLEHAPNCPVTLASHFDWLTGTSAPVSEADTEIDRLRAENATLNAVVAGLKGILRILAESFPEVLSTITQAVSPDLSSDQ